MSSATSASALVTHAAHAGARPRMSVPLGSPSWTSPRANRGAKSPANDTILLYTRSHIWLRVHKKAQRCEVGITRTGAQLVNSEITRVQLPCVGAFLDANKGKAKDPRYRRFDRGDSLRESDALNKRLERRNAPLHAPYGRALSGQARAEALSGLVGENITAGSSSAGSNNFRGNATGGRTFLSFDDLLENPRLLEDLDKGGPLRSARGGVFYESPESKEYSETKELALIGDGHGRDAFASAPAASGGGIRAIGPYFTLEGLYSQGKIRVPLSGVVSKVNERLVNEPWLVSQSPEALGWLFELRLDGIPDYLYKSWKGAVHRRNVKRNEDDADENGGGTSLSMTDLLGVDDGDLPETLSTRPEKMAFVSVGGMHTMDRLNRDAEITATEEDRRVAANRRNRSKFLVRRDYIDFLRESAHLHDAKSCVRKGSAALLAIDPDTWQGAHFISVAGAEELMGEDDSDISNFLKRELALTGVAEFESLLVFPPEMDAASRSRVHRLARQLGAASATNVDEDSGAKRVFVMRIMENER
ncbi:unnamed protein product [Amoebophrya sp. A25]|nr:unnamed protein product [Amoebophrya sp. A25]|eukprot:GSA25T00001800001.1